MCLFGECVDEGDFEVRDSVACVRKAAYVLCSVSCSYCISFFRLSRRAFASRSSCQGARFLVWFQ